MFIKINKETKRIVEYVTLGTIFPKEEGEVFEINEPQDTSNLLFSKYIDGEIIYFEQFKKEALEEQRLNELRYDRSTLCFSIINRGPNWHNRLTEAQAAELDEWYQAWLDVTETKTIPTKPEWIK